MTIPAAISAASSSRTGRTSDCGCCRWGGKFPHSVQLVAVCPCVLQGENLFTITGYPGLDPSLPARDFTGAAGDVRDQYRNVDVGTYPSNRTITVGISTTF
jgi:hypothetical protein